MAASLRTMGTTATTSLSAVKYSQSPLDSSAYLGTPPALDMAALAALIKDDLNQTGNFAPNKFFDFNGLLMIPRRGLVRVLPGDFVAVDTQTGWPILVSALAAASNPSWVHS